jgi:DNA-directed RNA polymerase subunit N (RpoN/RPB10)
MFSPEYRRVHVNVKDELQKNFSTINDDKKSDYGGYTSPINIIPVLCSCTREINTAIQEYIKTKKIDDTKLLCCKNTILSHPTINLDAIYQQPPLCALCYRHDKSQQCCQRNIF